MHLISKCWTKDKWDALKQKKKQFSWWSDFFVNFKVFFIHFSKFYVHLPSFWEVVINFHLTITIAEQLFKYTILLVKFLEVV